jgi:hypothetical protein
VIQSESARFLRKQEARVRRHSRRQRCFAGWVEGCNEPTAVPTPSVGSFCISELYPNFIKYDIIVYIWISLAEKHI